MQLPPLPRIPIDLNLEEKEFLTSLDGKIDGLLVAGREDNKLYAMGNRGGRLGYDHFDQKTIWDFSVREYVTLDRETTTGKVEECSFQGSDYTPKESAGGILTLGLYVAYRELTPAQRGRISSRRNFISRARNFEKKNLADIEEKIKPIRLYQGTIEEVERDIGRPLERVDTNLPETYIQREDIFWLRVQTYLLGGDAVVHYQPGSAIGTPVRFK